MSTKKARNKRNNRGVITNAIMKNFKIYGALVFALCAGTVGTVRIMNSTADDGRDNPPKIQILDLDIYDQPSEGFRVKVRATDDNKVEKVEYFINDRLTYVTENTPYEWNYNGSLEKKSILTVKATDNKGQSTISEEQQLN